MSIVSQLVSSETLNPPVTFRPLVIFKSPTIVTLPSTNKVVVGDVVPIPTESVPVVSLTTVPSSVQPAIPETKLVLPALTIVSLSSIALSLFAKFHTLESDDEDIPVKDDPSPTKEAACTVPEKLAFCHLKLPFPKSKLLSKSGRTLPFTFK